jgi:hypothetical protein
LFGRPLFAGAGPRQLPPPTPRLPRGALPPRFTRTSPDFDSIFDISVVIDNFVVSVVLYVKLKQMNFFVNHTSALHNTPISIEFTSGAFSKLLHKTFNSPSQNVGCQKFAQHFAAVCCTTLKYSTSRPHFTS